MKSDYLPPISEDELSDDQVLIEIDKIKKQLGDTVCILGHHYQKDEIIRFADYTGDSLQLARIAASLPKAKYIIFAGVHFMAETADMLSREDQVVILPDMRAGCSMADMASLTQVQHAWQEIAQITSEKIIPVTYVNCTAELKSFVGEKGGTICTSSNAKKVVEWAFTQGKKLLFFPDQHLGRNTAYSLGIPLKKMVVYSPEKPNGGLTTDEIKNAQVILWYGHCSVHQGFTASQIKSIKEHNPETKVIVHPECNFEVVQTADDYGSTSYIINQVEKMPAGASIAIGTEIHLVNRLQSAHPDKKIFSLSPYQCLCTTMYRIRPRWLLQSLKSIAQDSPINVIKVPKSIAKNSIIALDRMLNI